VSDTPRPRDDEPDFAELFRQLLGDADNPAIADAMRSMGLDQANPAMMGALAAQFKALFAAAPTDGINRELCEDVARKTVSAGGDTVVTDAQRREVEEAVHVADLWLAQVTSFEAPEAGAQAWSRAEWVTRTMPVWAKVVAPVATGVNAAIGKAMRGQFEQFTAGEMPALPGLPPGLDLAGMMQQFEPMLGRMSSSMFGAQIGQAVGALGGEVVSATEVGLPLLERPAVALIPANVAAFAEGLELDVAQVRLYLALRESARVRLFADVGWLGPQLLGAVQAYARDIRIDTEGIESKITQIDARNPEEMQKALADTLFSPEPSEAQKTALARLETLLALVEGWVDVVAGKACEGRLPQVGALAEAVRRRRANGGPAEAIFGNLVGLQLRPRRLRDAANLFSALESAGGAAARDGAWAHPDVAPTAEDLDDVLGYVERARGGAGVDDGLGGLGSEIDAALEQILASADRQSYADEQRAAAEEDGPIDGGPWPRNAPKPPEQPGDEGTPDATR
jgi:putative hydrolase